jgi:hypothetical protein
MGKLKTASLNRYGSGPVLNLEANEGRMRPTPRTAPRHQRLPREREGRGTPEEEREQIMREKRGLKQASR